MEALAAIGLVSGLLLLLWLGVKLREDAKRQQRRRDGRRKAAAYSKAWRWVMSIIYPRVPRLTDQRTKTH